MIGIRKAKRLVKPTTNKTLVERDQAEIKDILDAIFLGGRLAPEFTRELAPQLKRKTDMATLRAIWSFVRNNIRYRRDEGNVEVVKSPGKLLYDGYGDCKSFTIIIGSLLDNLGYRWKYRVAFYDPETPEQGHIYPVVVMPDGSEVILDAVHDTFNEEVPYWRAYDYDKHGNKMASLSGIPGQGNWLLWALLAIILLK
ncbi:MAG: transglutaminase domain-containing protein [Alphaproteobacteria bacterium]|nr:MAG: transglutaminase domain-containing protein [Alphaproteobacteria bacterium]